ncbi:MAG: penicillin-binding protein 2 [Pseudomonadota bacterium]|nr:penicillin-binding protein 2 [Pseudomonadota bacterium]
MNPRFAPPPPASSRRGQGPNPRKRLLLVIAVLVLASTGLVVRAVDLQVIRKQFYLDQGDARFLREVPIQVSRGTIFDRNGVPLAVSTPVVSIWANPAELLQHADRLPALAKALDVDAGDLAGKLQERSGREFVYLRRQMSPDAAQDVLGLNIPGVNSQREYKRYYPSGAVMAHVLGFTNIDDHGQEGLELAYDAWLAGKPGEKRVIRDRLGHTVENVEQVRAPVPGHDLTLSIDSRIQYLAYTSLAQAIAAHHASSGSMVILDVPTGEILAMVNVPSYNPNALDGSTPAARRNRAVTDVVEPGSTMKAFTVATALESGKWTPTTPIDTSPGSFEVGGHIIRDTHDHGMIDVTHMITYSSDVGAAKISLTLTAEQMRDLLHRFGFGQNTGSGFPGESPGYLPVAHKWGTLEKATIAYGYGLNVTPLQIARGYAGIATGGRVRETSFVKGADNPAYDVLDPRIAHEVLQMLRTVVSPLGTAPDAAIANYTVAGKTGTSHIASGGGYADRYFSLFTGVVPYTSPRLVGVVVVTDPGGGKGGSPYYGGLVSAPVFAQVMTGAMRLLDVPPDNVQRWYAGGPDLGMDAANKPVTKPEQVEEEVDP